MERQLSNNNFFTIMNNMYEVLQDELDDYGDLISFNLNENGFSSECLIKILDEEHCREIAEKCFENFWMNYCFLEKHEDVLKYSLSYNACVVCKKNLGINNPRQYCRKYYCEFG
jgi:hypothetical protein